MATFRRIPAKPFPARCVVLLALFFLCLLIRPSPAAAQEEPTIPAQFHVPTEAEIERAGQLLSDALDLYDSNPTRARELLHQSVRIFETSWGPDHPETAGKYYLAAFFLPRAQWLDGAEEMARRAVAISEKYYGVGHGETVATVGMLAEMLKMNDQPAQAEAVYRAALAIEMRTDPAGLGAGNTAFRVAKLIAEQRRFDEAQPFFDQSLVIQEKLEGPTSAIAALALQGVGENYYARGKIREAQDILTRAARIPRDQFNTAPQIFPEVMTMLGRIRQELGDTRGAETALAEAVNLTRIAREKRSWYSRDAEVAYGNLKRQLGQPADAVRLLRAGCEFDGEMDRVSLPTQRALTQCTKETVLALREWAVEGGGHEADDRPAALRAEAFEKVQYAELFESGYGLARYGARIEAVARGAGSAIRAYDDAQSEYQYQRRLYADSFAGRVDAARRPGLVKAIERAYSEMLRQRNRIRLSSPLYWKLQQPEAIELGALQSREGGNDRLLGKDEALVVFMIPPGAERGVVFAITKTGFEWADIRLTGEEIAARVGALRAQIDRKAYGASGAAAERPFDRKAAHELYLELFGDQKIAGLLARKTDWLIVPSGALTSLPPGLLVTAKPPGGREADGDPSALRATQWLLRDKAITVLPGVASLRTLRQLLHARGDFARTSNQFLAFADPDFAGASYGYPPPPPMATSAPVERGRPLAARAYFRGDQPRADSLRTLDKLKGTSIEAEAVRERLRAPRNSVYSGKFASETKLRQLQAEGRLARAQVILFATHGLVSGELGLAQPALALAAPGPKADPALDDGLLTAAEAAGLTLNADWVILSACNTAAPDAPDAQGLSGLVNGFFSAGARSLLISHWRVRDDVAAILIPDTLARFTDGRAKTKADALRQAALAILDDTSHPDFASSFAWAPFVLVGETVR